jgi:hypothetical protein
MSVALSWAPAESGGAAPPSAAGRGPHPAAATNESRTRLDTWRMGMEHLPGWSVVLAGPAGG